MERVEDIGTRPLINGPQLTSEDWDVQMEGLTLAVKML